MKKEQGSDDIEMSEEPPVGPCFKTHFAEPMIAADLFTKQAQSGNYIGNMDGATYYCGSLYKSCPIR